MNIRHQVVGGGLLFLTAALALPASTAEVRAAQSAPATKPASAPGVLELDPGRLEAAADAAARDVIRKEAAPGFSVAVARDGEVVFQKSYGMADVEMGVEATPDTVYRIGSITKQFTAAAVMRLVEQGKLSLDDPITKHLPDFPTQGHAVTIRHLLNHTSGIANYTRVVKNPLDRDFRLDMTYADMIELVGKAPFDFAPGERWQYNNTAYWLLSETVTRAGGMPYDEFLEKELLRPNGLEQTLVADHREIVPNRAEGYHYEGPDALTNAPFISINVPGGGGAISSTVGDLARWAHLLHTGKVVSAESYKLMTTPTKLADGKTETEGFGLHLEDRHGRRAITHGGNISGFTSDMAYYPESGVSIAVLVNVGNTIRADEVEAAVARVALGVEGPIDLPLTPEQLAGYVGEYVVERGGRTFEFKVTSQNGRLRSQMPGSSGTFLRNQGEHVFIPTIDEDVRLIFEVTDDRAVAVRLIAGEREMRGTRKE